MICLINQLIKYQIHHFQFGLSRGIAVNQLQDDKKAYPVASRRKSAKPV